MPHVQSTEVKRTSRVNCEWMCGPARNAEWGYWSLCRLRGLKRGFTHDPHSRQEGHSHGRCGKGIWCHLPKGNAVRMEIHHISQNIDTILTCEIFGLHKNRPLCECEDGGKVQTLAVRGYDSALSRTCSTCTLQHQVGQPRK